MSLDKLVDSTQLDSDLGAVADAIRAKGGTSAQLAFPAEFVSAIAAIPAGGSAPTLQSKAVTVTQNGSSTITADSGYDGLSSVALTVNVPSSGGGNNGSYTPAEKTDSVTFNVAGDPSHFVFAADSAYAGGNGSSLQMVYAEKNGITVGMRTNSGATAYSATGSTTTVTFGSGTITVYSPLSVGIQPIAFSWAAW